MAGATHRALDRAYQLDNSDMGFRCRGFKGGLITYCYRPSGMDLVAIGPDRTMAIGPMGQDSY